MLSKLINKFERCLQLGGFLGIVALTLGNLGNAQQAGDLKLDALINAMQSRNATRARTIVNSKIDLNVSDRFGRTPLNEAIANHLPAIAIEMINRGADVEFRPIGQFSPLISAAWYCEKDVLVALLKHGAKVDATDDDGETALIPASANCKGGRIVRTLLRAGANPNAAAKNGYTGLIAAAESGNEVAARELLAAGADPTTKDSEGDTALSIARDHPFATKAHERIYALLVTASKQ
jgi:ankyrin repeat protein